ncbi:hypothetical protein ASE04_18905 [Rhizobium sp. Root708]|uniref:PAS domain-containing protein n=1 Tax=Rhizobium sp. Root708 TaxID=1736592 RepID=UPI0006F4C163|nr:PAS domain-containing protein [Rhizobium sp. Root708]KRB49239.1 hypothetical protein ASE04_18905 [Rhizobium sp. Root708]
MHVIPVPAAANMGAQALVSFMEGAAVSESEAMDIAPDAGPDEVRRLHAELKLAQEALVASRNSQEVTVQDLRASNEELQSINEEYRSTAEELETSKEELQSINEELHTVNAELKSKLASISVAHSDLQNLTTATEIGALFLDTDLRIKMFTPPVADLFNVTRADIGRAITDFRHSLEYENIEHDAQQVLKKLTPLEREIRSRGGQWFVMRLRPYRTIEDRIDGTVVTFVDITERRRTEEALRDSEEKYRTLFEGIDEGFLVVDLIEDQTGHATDIRYIEANVAVEQLTGFSGVVGKLGSELHSVTDQYWLEAMELFERVRQSGEPIRMEHHNKLTDRWVNVYIVRIGGADSRRICQVFSDITQRKRVEATLAGQREALELALKGGPLEQSLEVSGRTAITVPRRSSVCVLPGQCRGHGAASYHRDGRRLRGRGGEFQDWSR